MVILECLESPLLHMEKGGNRQLSHAKGGTCGVSGAGNALKTELLK